MDVPYGYDIDFKYANGAIIKAVNGTVSLRFEGTKGWIACEGWNGKFEASDMSLFRDKPTRRTRTTGRVRKRNSRISWMPS